MVNRLLPSYAPPKEGRTHSYNPTIKKWQRSNQARILALLVGVVVTYFVAYPFFASGSDLARPERSTIKNVIKNPTMPNVPSEDEHRAPTWPLDEPVAKHEPERIPAKTKPKQVPVAEPEEHEKAKPKVPTSKPKASKPKFDGGHPSKPEDKDEFLRKLRKVISLVPDEVNTREQLREPEGTGKERLREMGLRTRSFKTYFDAWEALHVVETGDSSMVRDDVVQYLWTIMSGQTLADTIRSYEQFRYFFQRLSNMLFPWTQPYWADHMTLHSHFRNGGRGIVLSAGDDQAPYLLTSIQTFRKLGCTLPIEIMYLGDSDLDEDYRQQLEELPDVVTRDMSQMINDAGWRVLGWAGKPFAILLSSFREVIFIDADSLFFEDPAVLFDDPGYVETGALFFRDRKIMPESKKRWLQQLLPKPISRLAKQSYMWNGESGHYQESGVVVVDKWKHFVAMLLVTRMNGPDRDSNKEAGIVGVYDMVYGTQRLSIPPSNLY
jgi:alpha 1,3-mannosyltransferase